MAPGNTLQEFPCFYTFKIFGRQSKTFVERVRAAVAQTLGTVPQDCMKVRESSGGRYLSVTIEMQVHNQRQLEQVYEGLRVEAEVLFCI